MTKHQKRIIAWQQGIGMRPEDIPEIDKMPKPFTYDLERLAWYQRTIDCDFEQA